LTDLLTWAPLLLTIGFLLLLFHLPGTSSKYSRALAAILCVAVSVRYLYWRIFFTTPLHQNTFQQVWARCFLLVEFSAVLSSMLVYFFMSRHVDRSATADARQHSPLLHAPVDIFISTYNEERDILERTIVGAKAIDHSDLRVWVLDDGARAWVQELAEELGALYVGRVKGKHAKAGNVNNGLQQALATGRRPEFLLLLDADFVASGSILQRVLGLFEEPDVGIVQTPQHFFNADPVQTNLLCSTVWPDEQRFFFNSLLSSKDAWGAAFCCGTSAVMRVAALEACGGMATETITEDMLTTFRMGEYGYRTIYLNERLSLGLAPESVKEFMSQRARWCLGVMQQMFTRWSFFGRGRVSLINRISFFDSILYWLSSASFKIMLLSAPMIYWFTGTAVIRATVPELLYWMAPLIAANVTFMGAFADNRVLPIMTDVTQILTVFTVERSVFTGLTRPFGQPFKVTAKGLSTTGITIQWAMLWRFALLAVLTLLGMVLHVFRYSPGHGMQGYSLNVFWSILNAAVLALACAVCVELPKRRRDERFRSHEDAIVRLEGGIELKCRLEDISLGGACAVREEGWRSLVGPAALVLDEGGLVAPFDVARRMDRKLALRFHADPVMRRALIVKLFTGAYHQEVEVVHVPTVLKTLAKALVS